MEPAVGDDERPETDDIGEEKNPGGDALAECGENLKGVTVLPKPRVAKSVMVDVLREHNKMLTLLRCVLRETQPACLGVGRWVGWVCYILCGWVGVRI